MIEIQNESFEYEKSQGTQLRIHLSLVTRFAVAQETVAFRVTQVRCCVLQHTLVGNGFIRSACHGFLRTHRSG